jgi:ADP-ribose pyrophosphatase YjhB (NUDIX family)
MSEVPMMVGGFVHWTDRFGNTVFTGDGDGPFDTLELAEHIHGTHAATYPHATFVELVSRSAKDCFGGVQEVPKLAFYKMRPDGTAVFKTTTKDIVPPPPSHTVGVTAVIQCGEHYLFVEEKFGPRGILKCVTGSIEGSELPEEGAVREVTEEVGLAGWSAAKCVAVVHEHESRPGEGDVNFIFSGSVSPDPGTGECPAVTVQEEEIVRAEWVHHTAVADHPTISIFSKAVVRGTIPVPATVASVRMPRGRAEVSVYRTACVYRTA